MGGFEPPKLKSNGFTDHPDHPESSSRAYEVDVGFEPTELLHPPP